MAEANVDEQAAQLRATLRTDERDLAFALERLEHVTAERLSLGRRLAHDPWLWLAGAATVGFLWALTR